MKSPGHWLSSGITSSSACLASRVIYGEEPTDSTLLAIETERNLHSFGFSQVRLRSHGDLAWIEVLPWNFQSCHGSGKKSQKDWRRAGYRYSTLGHRRLPGAAAWMKAGKEYEKEPTKPIQVA
ncbi:MAG: hypothetical protein IPI71_00010 [Methanolinea sp.]|nr:MAG: hypothetical protein IPI71_00010 [Methanolinea sp.]